MLGAVSQCVLVSDDVDPSYPAHKITIVPFAQDIRRDMSLWGQLFGFEIVTGSVSESGISFLSRMQGTSYYPKSNSAPSTPQKKSTFVKSVASPLASRAESSRSGHAQSYQYARAYDEKGTVYFSSFAGLI